MRINEEDILSFQYCPFFLQQQKKDKTLGQPFQWSKLAQACSSCARILFLRQLRFERLPSYQSLKQIWASIAAKHGIEDRDEILSGFLTMRKIRSWLLDNNIRVVSGPLYLNLKLDKRLYVQTLLQGVAVRLPREVILLNPSSANSDKDVLNNMVTRARLLALIDKVHSSVTLADISTTNGEIRLFSAEPLCRVEVRNDLYIMANAISNHYSIPVGNCMRSCPCRGQCYY